jgi:hypothetical protein
MSAKAAEDDSKGWRVIGYRSKTECGSLITEHSPHLYYMHSQKQAGKKLSASLT